MDHLQVTFLVDAPPDSAADFVESVMLEQSVETPLDVALRHAFVRENMLGRVTALEPLSATRVRARLELPGLIASTDVAQLLNVLFGNVSLHASIELEQFELPSSILEKYAGPRFGIEGIREQLQIFDRALTCSALKPAGLTVGELASLCRTMATGGIDVIKDDHYLADHPFSPFEERVRQCQEAVAEVAASSGRRSIYCPNLSGTPDDVRRALDFAQRSGVGAVMIAPMLLGLPAFYEIARRDLEVPVLLHPSFAGATRIRPEILLGKLFRLLGGDAVIFPNYGGRFSYSREACGAVTEQLRAPWGGLRPSLPVPAGGMTVERTPELVDFFGKDTMLLVGGGLLDTGEGVLERTRSFAQAVSARAT